ncbi:MAG: Ig-like domain-containing protein [Leptospiraceae bacterium]|nr:Ig-like domain-containing protein [Leptospiraceae bacterium]
MKTFQYFILSVLIILQSACSPDVERSLLQYLPLLFGNTNTTSNSAPTLTIVYTPNSFVFPVNQTITTQTPTHSENINTCSISPSLPTGLVFDPLTCAISGLPTVTQIATNYTVTAVGDVTSATTSIFISVVFNINISFASATLAGSESLTNVTIPVNLSSSLNATIDYAVTGGTATAADFTLASGTLTFTGGGATTQNISLNIANDSLDELDETIIITLSNPIGAILGATPSLTYTITDDDPTPTVQFTTVSQSIVESGGSILVTAQLSAISSLNVTIPITRNAISTNGIGESTLSATPLIIPAGSLSADLTVTIINDAVNEANETIVLDMGATTNATASGNLTHTITITNDDPIPTIAFNTASSTNLESTTAVTIPVSLSLVSGQTVTVDYAVTGGTATGSGTDFTLNSGTLTFAAGTASQNISFTVANDSLTEINESVIVTISNPTNSTLGGNTVHTYTITDDDPPTVAFDTTTSSNLESTTSVNVPVSLSAAYGTTVTVDYAVTGGTATAADFTLANGTLTFTTGVTSQNIALTINNDALDEINETIIITISNPSSATLGGNTNHTYLITDDDPIPTVQFTAVSQSVAENAGTMTVTAQLSAASGLSVDIPFTINGTSTAIGGGTDYSITASPLNIPAGSTTATITINIVNETLYEADETVVIDMGTPTNATASGTLTHTATITNDETAPTISFTSGTTISFGEAVGNYSLSATLSAISGLDSSVTLNTANGSATAGSDYTAQVTQTFTIPAGATTANFNIPITDDTIYEGDETFTITFSAPINSSISGGATQTVTITDNDIGILSAETLDCDANGRIDHYKLSFTNAVTDSTFPGYSLDSVGTVTTNWLIAGYSGVTLDHGTSVSTACSIIDTIDDSILYLKFNEGSFDTGAKPDLTTTATPGLSGAVGNLLQIFTASVTEADTAKPVVVSITPTDGATSVLLTANVDVTFSEDMNTATFVGANFTLTEAAAVAGTVSTISLIQTQFDPSATLTALQSHTVAISNMADINGITMNAFTSTFTTAPNNKVIGTVTSGIALGTGLTISNGTSSVNVTAGGTSTSYQTIADIAPGSPFNVLITSQPIGQICTLIDSGANLSGIAGASDITVDVNCVYGFSNGTGIQGLPLSANGFHLYQGNINEAVGSLLSGDNDAIGILARFNNPAGVISDTINLYVSDSGNHKIRKVDSSGLVTTIAGNGSAGNSNGTGLISSLSFPRGIATDGTYLYVSESASGTGGNRIKRILISTGLTETIAGDNTAINPVAGYLDGFGTAAKFDQPAGLALEGNILYIAEAGGNRIRKLDLNTKEVTTLSSGGFLNSPEGITLLGTFLYVANKGSHTILQIDTSGGGQSVFAGTTGASENVDAIGTSAKFSSPSSITHDGTFLYVADNGTNYIRQIEIVPKKVWTIVGNGSGVSVNGVGIQGSLTSPSYIYTAGKALFVTQLHGVRKVINEGLIAYYPLNKIPIDNAGTNHLTISGSATLTTGRFNEANGAYNFVSGSYLSNPTSPTVNITNVSLAAWVKWNGAGTGNEQQILAVGGLSNGYSLLLRNSIGNKLTILQQNSAWGVNCQFTLPTNIWTHITATSSSAGNWKMYINGKHICSESIAAPITPSGNISVGGLPSLNQFFSGAIAEARVYTRVLNDGEINELAQNANSAQVGVSYNVGATGLVGHYSFNNGSLIDAGPLNKTLAITGAATSSGIIGKDGDTNSAYSFSMNSGQYLNATTLGLPLNTSPRTICAWIKPDQTPSNSVIVSYGVGSPNNAFGISAYTANTIQVWNWTAPGANFTLEKPFRINDWQHICAMFDGTNVVVTYDGKSLGSQTFGTATTTASGVFRVGSNVNSASTFPGKIDDVRIYNNALSVTQVRELAVQVPEGLVARYDFQGDTKDVSGFGSDGSISGTVTPTSDRFGNSASAYKMPITLGNKITAPDTYAPMGASPRTLCLWFRTEPGSFSPVPFGYGNQGAGLEVIAVWLQSENLVRLWGQGADVNANVTILDYVWHHACATNNGTIGQVYVNGRQIASAGQVLNTVSDGFLSMGSYLNTREFAGSIDDMRVYNRVLTPGEIKALSGYHPIQVSSWNSSIGASSLKMHLQADSLSTSTTNVSLWKDSAGNGLDISQGTGADQPTYLSSGINGKPVVQFISNKYLTRPCSIDIGSLNNTIIGVMNNSVGGGTHKVLLHHGTKLLYYNGSNEFSLFNEVENNQKIASSTDFNSSVSIDPNMIFALNHNGTTGAMYKNNFNVSGIVNTTPGYNCSSALYFGRPSFVGDGFNGTVGEFLYFNATLPVGDRLTVSCYLSAKYGIPLAGGTVCP